MKGGVGVLANADQIPVSAIAAAPMSPVTRNMTCPLRSDMKSVYAFSLSGSKNPDSSNSMAFASERDERSKAVSRNSFTSCEGVKQCRIRTLKLRAS